MQLNKIEMPTLKSSNKVAQIRPESLTEKFFEFFGLTAKRSD